MDLILKVYLNPRMICTAQQKGACIVGGHIRFFTKHEVTASNERIRSAVLQSLKENDVPLVVRKVMVKGRLVPRTMVRDTIKGERPVRLDVAYFFPFQSSVPAKKQTDGVWMVERPDLDNLTKSVQDVLTELKLWDDDSQVACVHLEKHRTTEVPRLLIRVRTIDDCFNPEWLVPVDGCRKPADML